MAQFHLVKKMKRHPIRWLAIVISAMLPLASGLLSPYFGPILALLIVFAVPGATVMTAPFPLQKRAYILVASYSIVFLQVAVLIWLGYKFQVVY